MTSPHWGGWGRPYPAILYYSNVSLINFPREASLTLRQAWTSCHDFSLLPPIFWHSWHASQLSKTQLSSFPLSVTQVPTSTIRRKTPSPSWMSKRDRQARQCPTSLDIWASKWEGGLSAEPNSCHIPHMASCCQTLREGEPPKLQHSKFASSSWLTLADPGSGQT